MSNTPEDTELKLALKKDFNQLLVKEFTADWKTQQFLMEMNIDVMSLDNLTKLITLHTRKRELDAQKYILLRTLESFDHYSGTGNALHDIRKDMNKSIDCLDSQLTNPTERSE